MDAIVDYLPLIRQGFITTIQVTVLGAVLALVVAFALGLARLSTHRWLRWPAACLVEFLRGRHDLAEGFAGMLDEFCGHRLCPGNCTTPCGSGGLPATMLSRSCHAWR